MIIDRSDELIDLYGAETGKGGRSDDRVKTYRHWLCAEAVHHRWFLLRTGWSDHRDLRRERDRQERFVESDRHAGSEKYLRIYVSGEAAAAFCFGKRTVPQSAYVVYHPARIIVCP